MRMVPKMKKKYVKPQLLFISKINKLESMKHWDDQGSSNDSQHVVEVAYIRSNHTQKNCNHK